MLADYLGQFGIDQADGATSAGHSVFDRLPQDFGIGFPE